jgi:Rod binding domain-containing protein
MAAQLIPLGGYTGADLPPAMLVKLRSKAQEFEATTVGQLLQPMFDTVDTSKDLFSGGSAEQQWKPMMVTEMAKQISRAGGIGLAQPVLQSLIQAQETGAHGGRQAPSADQTTEPTTENGSAQ